MRSLHADLLAAQIAASRTPYIYLVFTKGATTYNYTARLKRLVHVEEPYGAYAQIWLNNSDLGTVDITGYYVDIGYGLNTDSGNRYSSAARMWVVQQSDESEAGRLETVLYLEDIWRILREIQDVSDLLAAEGPYLYLEYKGTDTIYAILEDILETSCNIDLDDLGSIDDGIIGTLRPIFGINSGSGLFEDAASMVYRLMNMTKCFLRPKGDYAGSNLAGFEVVYPDEDDAIDYKYYSYKAHYFYQNLTKNNVVQPNHIVVFANQNAETGEWPDIITGDYDVSATEGFYDEDGEFIDNPEYHLAAELTTQVDANLRAEAIYWKLFHELEWGVIVVPHNCGQELFDKVRVYDTRGQ